VFEFSLIIKQIIAKYMIFFKKLNKTNSQIEIKKLTTTII
jgi:hypothetical protein